MAAGACSVARLSDFAEEPDGETPVTILSKVLDAQNAASSFGDIAVTNSTEVHFGHIHKTYIQSPVTNVTIINGGDKDGLEPSDVPDAYSWACKGVKWIDKKWKSAPNMVLTVIGLLGVTLTTCVVLVLLLSGAPPSTDPSEVLLTSKRLRLVSRQEWLAQPSSGDISDLHTPVPFVIITHTATQNCSDQASCVFHVRYMQTFHIESRSFSDIGYNFLVGGDGAAYEGRGWDQEGAHTMGSNDKSIGLAFIGTFNTVVPPDRQLAAARLLIQLGVEKGKIAKDYKLFGHRQLIPSLSPGDALFKIIETWPHFVNTSVIKNIDALTER